MKGNSLKQKYVILIALLLLGQPLYSDCHACWQLQGVSITLRDSTEFTGYIIYYTAAWQSNYRLSHPDDPFDFPEDILKLDPNQSVSLLDTNDVGIVTRPKKNAMVALGDLRQVKIKEIKAINLYPLELDSTLGASRLQELTREQFQLLQNEPIETLFKNTGYSEWYFMSYDSSIVGQQLKDLRNDWWTLYHSLGCSPSKTEKYSRIVSFSISYD